MKDQSLPQSVVVQARMFEGLQLTLDYLTNRIDYLTNSLKTLGENLGSAPAAVSSFADSGSGSGVTSVKVPDFVDDYDIFFKELGSEVKTAAFKWLPKPTQDQLNIFPAKQDAEPDPAAADPDAKAPPPADTSAGTPPPGADAAATVPPGEADDPKADGSKAKEEVKKTNDEVVKGENEKEKASAASWAGMLKNAIAGSKKLQAINKALAIGSIVIDTAKAIAKAASSAPFPANIPAIAFATATGAAQLAAVKGQAHDGIDHVPSTGTYLLEAGERVVDRRLNRDLKDFLGGQGQPRQAGGRTVSEARTTTIAPNVNLTINGQADPDAVYSNRGALETMIRDIFADHAMLAPFGAR